ncbi:hypothetical protein DDT91_03345 [Algoriphagus sp. AK58]|nr:hypothetical protein [Algoriphagus sp. AK58]
MLYGRLDNSLIKRSLLVSGQHYLAEVYFLPRILYQVDPTSIKLGVKLERSPQLESLVFTYFYN